MLFDYPFGILQVYFRARADAAAVLLVVGLMALFAGCIEKKPGGINQQVLKQLQANASVGRDYANTDRATLIQRELMMSALIKALETGPKIEMISACAWDQASGKTVLLLIQWIAPQPEAAGLYINGGGLAAPISIPFTPPDLQTIISAAAGGVIYGYPRLLPADSPEVKALRAISKGEVGEVGIQLPGGEVKTVHQVHWGDQLGGG